MKKMYFAGLAALAVIAFGCADDKTNTPDPNNGGKIQGYVSLKIDGAPTTRTTGTPTEPGVGDENTINNITVVFTDASGVITASHAITAAADFDVNGSIVTAKPFKFDVGTHYVYALINASGVPATLTPGANIHQIITLAASEFASGYRNGSFFMTNERNSSTQQAGIEVNITAANTINNPAPAAISVDRVAVRIDHDATVTPTITDLTTAHTFITGVTVSGFATLNVNKQINVIQDWGFVNENSTTHNPLTYEALHTPVYGQPTSFVPSSNIVANQYFNNIGEYTTITKDVDGKIETVTDLTVGQIDIFGTTTVYVTENRPTMMFFGSPEQPTAGRGETTGVIYKVQAMNGGSAVPTFYSYKGVTYENLAALQANDDFVSTDLSTLSNPEMRGLGIKVYENGVMYYTYFILDPNAAHQYNNMNYYGVFRNSIYRLSINSIKDLGDDVPGGTTVDPNEPGEPGNPPIDTDEAYIAVTVTVKDWILNTIPIDF